MTAGFERIDEAARTGPLAGMVAGELIRSEVEVRTGRCGTSPRPPTRWRYRRLDVIEVAERLGYALAAAGTHPFARWQDQEVIDTQHYHLVESTLRYVAWRNNTFGIHVHTGDPRRRPRGCGVERPPQRAPRAPGRVVQLAVARGSSHPPALDPDPGVHEVLPALRDPRLAGGMGRVRGVRALPHRDAIDPRAHRDLVERPPASGVPDRRGADLRRAARVRACRGARGPDDRPHRSLRARVRGGPAAARATRTA